VLPHVAICGITPDVVLALVIYAALFHGKAGMWLGFGTGLFLDMYAPALGYNALMGTLIGYGVGAVSSRIYKELVLLWCITLFGGSLLHEIVIYAAEHELCWYFFMRYIVPGTIYTTVAGVGVFYVLRKLKI
jgi:rod shape-determining protein MreD